MMMGNSGGGQDSFANRRQHGRQQQQQQQQEQIKSYTRDLPCTLQELFLGTTKKVKVSFPPHVGGGGSHVYTINVVKGWKAGTKITFPPSTKFPVCMTFVITEAKKAINETTTFQRSGNDLIFRYKLDDDPDMKRKKQKVINIEVPLLPDGKHIWKRSIPTNSSLLRPGQKLTVPDLGMPIKGGPQRGNLIIEFY